MRQDGIIGHYRIVRSLGQGGMGEVYAAHDEKLKRKVAIKSIRAGDRLDESTKQRFLREARILSSLDHPYICKIFDYIETEDNDYLVLEFIEGETLTRAVADGVDASARLPMAEQIAQVLVTAHGEGIVHRDLKPMNIMVTPSGDIRVLDFGLAHSGQHRSSLTSTTTDHDAPEIPDHQDPDRTITYHERDDIAPDAEAFQTLVGRITGTPYYMSPEQARGEVVSAASDMYSFGLLLQFLFTGHAPYDEDLDTQAVLDRAKHCRTQAVTGVNHDLKDLIEALKSPAAIDRPTAAQTLQRLHWIMEKPRRRVRRAVIAILMLISLLAGLKYTLDLRHEQRLAVAAQQDAEHRRTQAEDLISFMLGDLRTRLEDLDRLDVLDAVGEQAMSYFASLPEQQLHDEELARVVQNLQQIGEVRIAQGQLAGASVSLNEARRLSRNLVDRDPSNQQWLFRLSQVHFYIGNVAWMQHDLDAMLESFLAYRDVVERLVDLNPDKLEWTLEEAYAQTNLGVVYQEQGRLDLAVPAIRESIRIKRMLTE
ncbi:MAG: protein kinase, partial [Planctomycetota bacterium]|nr:protein kinase [Planctomycetota bacterium]